MGKYGEHEKLENSRGKTSERGRAGRRSGFGSSASPPVSSLRQRGLLIGPRQRGAPSPRSGLSCDFGSLAAGRGTPYLTI
ncbi:hypothetical protein NL676_004896 [Syzygium grande]|nr:hypothetical protein NL676_004896 [Syzygium grande]